MLVSDRGQQFGAWYDFAKDLIPKKTIVGKLLSGDVAGAATGVVKLTQPVKTAAGAATKLPAKTPGAFSPGGFVEKNQTVLLLVAAGLGAFLIMGRKKKGRR